MTMLRTAPRGAAAILAALLGIGGTALAIPPEGGRPARRPPPRQEMGPGSSPDTEEMREAMEQVMIVRMKSALQLTPRQEEKVVPQVQNLLEARREFAAKRRAAMSHLRALLLDETADDQAIETALKEAQSIEGRFRDREQGLKEAINSGLTPRQQARLLFFEEQFRRMMQRRLQEAAGPGGRPRAPAPPGRPPEGPPPPAEPGGDLPPEGEEP